MRPLPASWHPEDPAEIPWYASDLAHDLVLGLLGLAWLVVMAELWRALS